MAYESHDMSKSPSPDTGLFHPDGRIRLELFTERAAMSLRAAVEAARQMRWESVRSPHLFIGLLKHPDTALQTWADRADIDLKSLLTQFKRMFQEPVGNPQAKPVLHREFLSDNLIQLLRKAWRRARDFGRAKVNSIDLLLSVLISRNSVVAECLKQAGISVTRLVDCAVWAEKEVDG